MQYRKIFQSHDQTENSREKLGKNCSPCCSGHAHMKWYNKKYIKKNIQYRRKHQKIKRCFAVAQCPKHIGDHIIKNSGTCSKKYYKHVFIGFTGNITWNLHPSENLMRQKTTDQSQNNSKGNTENSRRCNAFPHSFFIFGTTSLTKTDSKTSGKTVDETENKINNDTGGSYSGKRFCSQSFAYNDRISERVKKLK